MTLMSKAEPDRRFDRKPTPKGARRGPFRALADRAARSGVRRRRRTLLVTALVAIVAGAAAVVFAVLTAWQSAATDSARDAATAAARTTVEQVLSYDPASLDADMARARADVTGDFGQQLNGLLASLVQPAVQQGLTTVTTTKRIGVVSASTSEVVVLMYLDQRSTRAGAQPVSNGSKALVTMRPVDGRWLIADLRAA